MKHFPRGSEWRKWDLHVHPPTTKLNDGYQLKDRKPDWGHFCQVIHESDVQAIGVTDYFSFDSFFEFKANYQRLYPHCEKVFFPNLELRLNEAVNKPDENVDFHIVFRPDLTREQAGEFLTELKTQTTDGKDKKQSCTKLTTSEDFESATVSRDDIRVAINNSFGDKATWTDHVILLAAANNNGIRADTGSKRKMNIADEIDKFANGFFGNPRNVDYYLKQDRYYDLKQPSVPKPVFSGSDAHNFSDLRTWLGKDISIAENQKHITWVKADLTFEGLQQTLIEPSERVKIQPSLPDFKEPYKCIAKIKFPNSSDFPDEIIFNPNLNAIIGSRSSGKSALLAYIAHAVSPEYTVAQQVLAMKKDPDEVGPAAAFTWADVSNIDYDVEWAAPTATSGQVIYIPQNSLYAISERPSDITAKIRPAVFRRDLAFAARFKETLQDVDSRNDSIRNGIDKWFILAAEIVDLESEISSLGDKKAIIDQRDKLIEEIKILSASSMLSTEEVEQYQQLLADIGKNDERLQEIEQEQQTLASYVVFDDQGGQYVATERVDVSISISPNPALLSNSLADRLSVIITSAQVSLLKNIKDAIVIHRGAINDEQNRLINLSTGLRTENSGLIEKNNANSELALLAKNQEEQAAVLGKIEQRETLRTKKLETQEELLKTIATNLRAREEILRALQQDFNASNHTLEDMTFTIELDFNADDIEKVSAGFNKHETSPYINKERQQVDIEKAHSDSAAFVKHMSSGKQKINRLEDAIALSKAVLTTTKEMRFVASLEGDRIGGFGKSSMTPGKQALFALTLILSESDEPWPLLIDQPEDDLDSRSIYDLIVQDLLKRKRKRQIIMVSHNANLVIGADSEEVIVANRHGDDRPNLNSTTFAYLSGSLEFSQPRKKNATSVLESAGIREHACEILDGGKEAFQKRKEKYKI